MHDLEEVDKFGSEMLDVSAIDLSRPRFGKTAVFRIQKDSLHCWTPHDEAEVALSDVEGQRGLESRRKQRLSVCKSDEYEPCMQRVPVTRQKWGVPAAAALTTKLFRITN